MAIRKTFIVTALSSEPAARHQIAGSGRIRSLRSLAAKARLAILLTSYPTGLLFIGRPHGPRKVAIVHWLAYNRSTISPNEVTTMSASKPLIQIETSCGEIFLELDRDKAPVSVDNFIAYANAGHYDGTIFHRVIKGFMIQGGGLTADMQEKPTGAPIVNEASNKLKNKLGTVAMARTGEIDSATAQFFINTENNKDLDHGGLKPEMYGYAVFGQVVDGMDVVYTIEQQATTSVAGYDNVPMELVVIKAVTVLD
jgi:peptidyl-prolyl cis-trans isomerase B (cyclophilin B)